MTPAGDPEHVTSAQDETGDDGPVERRVTHTRDRDHEREYVVQVRRDLLDELFPGDGSGGSGFLVVRNPGLTMQPEIHVRYREEDASIGAGEVGLDFTLRYGLGVAASSDTAHGDTDRADVVELEPTTNMEPSGMRRKLNWLIGVRPQICRVRMGVLPDLEDKVCRLPENTLQVLGVEEGDYICLESSADIVRGVKAFAIDDDTREKKEEQEKAQSDHYVNCWEEMGLNRLRRPEVDIPDVYIDSETRRDLGLVGRGTDGRSGVCQPVRAYRDSVGVLTKSAYEIAVPFALVLVAHGIGTGGPRRVAWFLLAGLLVLGGYLIRHRSMLGGYGFGSLLE